MDNPSRAVAKIMDSIPMDDDRTPVRYGGIYRAATKEELERDARQNNDNAHTDNSHKDSSSLTHSPPPPLEDMSSKVKNDDAVAAPPSVHLKKTGVPAPDAARSNTPMPVTTPVTGNPREKPRGPGSNISNLLRPSPYEKKQTGMTPNQPQYDESLYSDPLHRHSSSNKSTLSDL